MIAFVTYGFAVVNEKQKKLPKQEGPTREQVANAITEKTNKRIAAIHEDYVREFNRLEGRQKQQDELTAMYVERYANLMKEHNETVNKTELPPETPFNPAKKFWNWVITGGICMSLLGCLGSAYNVVAEEEATPPASFYKQGDVEWNADNIPMPHLEDSTEYVANPDGILSEEALGRVNATLADLDHRLNIESAVAFVNHIEGDDPFRFAQDMGNKYGVGKGDRGLVIVVGYKDHSVNISPGNALEADLTDSECDYLLGEYFIPYIKLYQPDSALIYLTDAVYNTLRHKELEPSYLTQKTKEAEKDGIQGTGGFSLMTILLLFLSGKLRKKGLLGKQKETLVPLMGNPVFIPTPSSDSDDDRPSRSSSRSSSSSRGGSYGGGHFSGGGATRRW